MLFDRCVWRLGYIYLHCNLCSIAVSCSPSLTLYPGLAAAAVPKQSPGHALPLPYVFRKCIFIGMKCSVCALVNYSLKLLYTHLESPWFSIWLKFCSVFPKMATLTNLHYLFLKPCLYFLCFYVIFIWSSDLWIIEICTLGEKKHVIKSLLLECSFSVYIQKWMDVFRVRHTPL